MVFGPFSTAFIERIQKILDKGGAKYTVSFSKEEIQRWRKEQISKSSTVYPTYHGPVEALFIEIEPDDITRLKDQLTEFGITLEQNRPTELDAFEDFVCPKCGFSGGLHQLCPTHFLPLVPYTEKTSQRSSLAAIAAYIILAVIFGTFIVRWFASS